jgi:excisionase family DNA binding protein
MLNSCSPAGSPTFVTPSADDAAMLQESSRKFEDILATGKSDIRVCVQPGNQPEQAIPIPLSAFRMLVHMVTQMAHGNAVTLIPMHAELTTYEAARVLKVSRPFLIGLLEKGEIPFRKVGTHRRIRYQDLMAYKQRTDQERIKALEELSALHQELGLD